MHPKLSRLIDLLPSGALVALATLTVLALATSDALVAAESSAALTR